MVIMPTIKGLMTSMERRISKEMIMSMKMMRDLLRALLR
jgi:hypothetical protein